MWKYLYLVGDNDYFVIFIRVIYFFYVRIDRETKDLLINDTNKRNWLRVCDQLVWFLDKSEKFTGYRLLFCKKYFLLDIIL
jgi:hypothetical protein